MHHRGVVYQDIKPALLLPHLLEKLPHLLVIGMVAVNGDTPAAGRADLIGRGLHRSGEGRIPLTPGAPGHVHGGTGGAQGKGDSPARSAAGTGHDHYPVLLQTHSFPSTASVIIGPPY